MRARNSTLVIFRRMGSLMQDIEHFMVATYLNELYKEDLALGAEYLVNSSADFAYRHLTDGLGPAARQRCELYQLETRFGNL